MKKFIISLFLLTIFSGICFSQSKKFEGYDNMPWGTTLEEFKKQNPSAYDKTKADNVIRNEKLYYKDGNSVIRVYRFLIINSVGEELFMKILQKQPVTQLLKN